ncbi:MAG: hypothetical protein QM779_10210 [Propionicimonas sp.]|uniref:hypothetical protein n=1 Tax=Propionicimonas sp. TaxID=1955623 RepID=UPI003D121143
MRSSRTRLARVLTAASLAALLAVPTWTSSPAASADDTDSTTTAASSSLVVATFNVRCANCSAKSNNSREKSWAVRSDVVVRQILGEKVDVIGVQEASPGLLHGSAYGDYDGKSQFENLVGLLGSPYKVTNDVRYNCTRTGTTFTRCGGFQDRGASQDSRIIYNSNRLTLLDSGSLRLDSRAIGNGSARYMTWAKFTDQNTGKKFIFATAHFEPGVSKSKSAVRVKQVKKATAELADVNTSGLPIIWGSDLASSKLTHVGNKSYDAFIANGFVDPLGNSYKAKTIPASAELTASTAVNEEYFTLNKFNKAPTTYEGRGYKLGAHLDYILTKGDVETTAWKEVINLDSSGDFAGVIPSDHNMVRATVTLG